MRWFLAHIQARSACTPTFISNRRSRSLHAHPHTRSWRCGPLVFALLLLGLAQTCSPQLHPAEATSSHLGPHIGGAAAWACGAYKLSHGRARPAGAVQLHSTVLLRCDPGYELDGVGDATVQCLLHGRFTTGRSCRPVSCGALMVPGGIADPSGEIAYPDAAKLTCGRGYRPSPGGTAERHCLGDGRFSEGMHCEPAERWTAADVQHARADLLAEILVTGQDFVPGAFYECHLTLSSNSGARSRITTQVRVFSACLHRAPCIFRVCTANFAVFMQ